MQLYNVPKLSISMYIHVNLIFNNVHKRKSNIIFISFLESYTYFCNPSVLAHVIYPTIREYNDYRVIKCKCDVMCKYLYGWRESLCAHVHVHSVGVGAQACGCMYACAKKFGDARLIIRILIVKLWRLSSKKESFCKILIIHKRLAWPLCKDDMH